MKLLVSFLKFIQSLCLLLIPILIFYCMLASVQIVIIDQYKEVLGTLLSPISVMVSCFDQILGPLVSIFKNVANFEIKYNSSKLDFTHFVAAGGLFCFYHLVGAVNSFIDFLEKKGKDFNKIKAQKKAEYLVEQKMLEDINEFKSYRTTSIILRIKKTENNISYLTNVIDSNLKTEDALQQVESLILTHSGTRYNELEKNGDYYIIFKNIENFINFTFELQEKIKTINESLSKEGNKITYYLFADNFTSKSNRECDFREIDKLFYLTGENQIFSGETLKKYYECFSSDTHLKFISKGLYAIGSQKEIEIYSLNKKVV